MYVHINVVDFIFIAEISTANNTPNEISFQKYPACFFNAV
jgi:hypothetical protein